MPADPWETASSLQVARANLRPFARSERQEPMWDESLHLVVGIAGSGTVHLRGRRHHLAAGGLLAIPWAVPVSYHASPEAGLTIASIHLVPWPGAGLPPEPRTRKGGAAPARPPPPLPPLPDEVVVSADRPNVTDLALAAIAAWSDAERSAGWRAHRLRGLAACLFTSLAATRGGVRPIDALLWWLQASIRHPITRADMCRRAKLGQTALGRMVRAATGHSPTGWLIRLRLEEAHRLLSTTRMPVAQVAGAVGFRDRSHFSRLYKRRFGEPPSGIGR